MNQTIRKRIEDIKNGVVPKGYKKTKVGIVPIDWEETRFKKMFSRLTRKNKEGNNNVLTISAQYGLISQSDFFNKTVASEDKSNYFLLHKGEYAYNKSYSNGYPYGALKRLEFYDKGIVSPLYICFSKTEENNCPDFYSQYFEAGLMNKEIKAFAQEGARNHGLLNIAVDDFFNSYLLNPPVVEQEKIAEILETQDNVIKLKEKLIEQKKQQKKYLMQQLLTGKKRLPGFTGEWKLVKIGNSFKVISGYPFDSKNFTDSGVSVIRIQNIDNGVVNLTNSAKHNKFDICQYNVAYTGDVLIAMSGATTGKIGVYLGEEEAYINQRVGKFIVLGSNVVKKQYLIQILLSELFFDKLKVLLSTGAQPNIGSGDLEKMKFVIPMEVKEQQAIANILSQADKEIELLQKDLEEEKNKKKALMQLLLTGIVRFNYGK